MFLNACSQHATVRASQQIENSIKKYPRTDVLTTADRNHPMKRKIDAFYKLAQGWE